MDRYEQRPGSPFSPGAKCLLALLTLLGLTAWVAPAPAQPDDPAENVLALVNGTPVTEARLEGLVAAYEKKKRRGVTAEEKGQLLDNLITRRLILQKPSVQAMRNDPRVAARIQEFEEELLVERYLKEQIGSKVSVSDEEIRAYYDQHRHEFSTPPKVVARHILLRNREDAEKVLALLGGGKDFRELAKQWSIDLPMALKGGTMGTIEKGKTLPELEEALFQLQPGEVSGIVETRFGHHILTIDNHIARSFKPLNEVKQAIAKRLFMKKEADAYSDMVRALRGDADIVIYGEDVQDAGVAEGVAHEKPPEVGGS